MLSKKYGRGNAFFQSASTVDDEMSRSPYNQETSFDYAPHNSPGLTLDQDHYSSWNRLIGEIKGNQSLESPSYFWLEKKIKNWITE